MRSELISALEDVEQILSQPERTLAARSGDIEFDFSRLQEPTETSLPAGFEIGHFASEVYGQVPAFLPFEDTRGIAFAVGDPADFIYYNEFLEKSVLKILSAMAYDSYRLLLIDGKNYGTSFNFLARLSNSLIGDQCHTEPDGILRALENVRASPSTQATIVVIHNFPFGFSNEGASRLLRLLNDPPASGFTVFMTKELKPARPIADLDAALAGCLELITFGENGDWHNDTLCSVPNLREHLFLNCGTSFSAADSVVETANAPFRATSTSNEQAVDISQGLRIPIGSFNDSEFHFVLGHETENYHGIVAGASGQGKTVFLDNIIARGASLYSPEELRFVLVDLKGIEFGEYKDSSHVQAFSSTSSVEKSMKIIDFLKSELDRRESAFRTEGASSIQEYRKKGVHVMPRLLVIIDEFQTLFGHNYKTDTYVESVLIDEIVRKGRAFGIHLLCCTQSLGSGVRSSFLNNIPLRIAFKMAPDVSRAFLSMNNPHAETLRVGQAIYNANSGAAGENKTVSIYNIQSEEVRNYIAEAGKNTRTSDDFERVVVD